MTDEPVTRRWLAELAWLPGQGVCRDVLIEAGGDRFTSVSPGTADAPAGAGHASLGWPDAGEIAPGARAGLVTVSLDSIRTAGGPGELALEAAVFAATSTDVRSVVISGRDVVQDGVHQLVPDVPGELSRTIRAALG
jgi:cytosine/adenosine deaminase-related metal-dependent hydrolase